MVRLEPSLGDESFNSINLFKKNANVLMLGDSTHEGGDVRIYRDGSNNLALFIDADAPSNAKGFDVYGGVVFQNYLTVGKSTLDTSTPLYVEGAFSVTGTLKCGGSIQTWDNQASLQLNIPVVSSNATDHEVLFRIDNNTLIRIKGTGDGAGGVEDLKVIINEQLVYTPSSDTAITAAGGITVTKPIMRVAGDGGAIDITANPQIVAGTDGQVVIIQGTHDTNTVTLDDGTGLALSAQCVLAAQDNITLIYDSGDSEWIETSRTTVV